MSIVPRTARTARWVAAATAVCRGTASTHGRPPRQTSFGAPAVTSGLLAVLLLIAPARLARAETPLYDEDPYDQITLNAAFHSEVLKIKPLSPTVRRSAAGGKAEGKIMVRRVVDPDKEYEVLWRNIAKVELFEQLVLDKANELVADSKFDEAYDYFAFLQRNYYGMPGLTKAGEDFLFAEANAAYHKGQYDSALALLRELYRRNAKRPSLDRVLGATTDKLVEQYVAEGNYPAARVLLNNLATEFPEAPVVMKWRQQWQREASPLRDQAIQAAQSNDWGKTAELTRRLTSLAPDLPGVRELAKTVHDRYGRVTVGVTALATDVAASRLDDWASRRAHRLVYRTLTELIGPSTEGGQYECPVGEITSQAVGNRRLSIHLKPDVHWAQGSATLTGAELARLLLATAAPGSSSYRIDWSDLLTGVSVAGVYDVQATLRRSHVHPKAMLQILLTPPGATAAGQAPPSNGPLVLKSQTPQETVFGGNAQYFANEAGRPMELVERRFDTVAQAVAALKRGDVDVVDRVNPWTLPSLNTDARLTVQPYSMPLVHCLIANVHRPVMSDRTFRRGLAYGIHCQMILQQLLAGAEIPGCETTSSPFPLGIGVGDPMGYATDETIKPRSYDPRLCIALANVAYQNYLDAKNKKAGDKPAEKKPVRRGKTPPLPKLILAYPPDEIARASCSAIQKQLQWLGIPVTLRPLECPLPKHVPDDVDLLYVELAAWEPVVDANRLFGEGGMVTDSGPYMSLALRQLDQAAEWEQVRDCLRRVHRIAYNDVAVIPLWQLMEHFAYRKSLRGVAPRPVTLYQSIEHWRPIFQYPGEK